jgi:hypothetical protein
MEKNKAIDLGILTEDEQSGVKRVSLVEEPAIELDFRYFGKQYSFVKPSGGESQDAFISRCIPVLIKEGKPDDQAAAICYSYWKEGFAVDLPHYTKDGVLYEGPTHKDATGRLMTGVTHTPESQYLYHEDELQTITCYNCDWSWNLVDGGADPYICHNCGADNTPEDFDIDTSSLAPYVAPYIKKNGKAEKPIIKAILMEDWSKDAYIVDTILALAAELGTKEADLAKLFTMEFSNPTAGGAGTSVSEVLNQGDKKLYLYKYEGRVTPNSREFCIGMVGLDNFYTKAQIQAMSDIAVNAGFGINGASTYSIWSFHGGPNCKHVWSQYLVTMPNGQITIEYVKPAAGRAGVRPYDLPKHGYYSKAAFKFASEDQMILVGPAMVPDISIPRLDADGDKYFVRFSAETIKEICMKYFKEARTNDVNTDHEENSAGAYIYESWIVEDPLTDKANTVYGYQVPVGTWMVTMKVDDKATWARIKSGELRGFSIEGILMDLEELEAKKKFEDIIKIMRDK